MNEYYGGIFWYSTGSNKIMSWLGDWSYQLGVFGILMLVVLFKSLYNGSLTRLLELVVLAVFLLAAIPVGFPLVPALMALWVYKDNCKRRTVYQNI
ncbi:hypothetical protein [Marinobacter sp. LV10MA510-1]|uniref:hypothetical protein n=1 Tax=Marinobacter sp. LV10MA510-1 TaxID=1415567 RepID=UPI00117C560C|nr:hypothetical protein [Marinobacter sp. LV10MA510-1]